MSVPLTWYGLNGSCRERHVKAKTMNIRAMQSVENCWFPC